MTLPKELSYSRAAQRILSRFPSEIKYTREDSAPWPLTDSALHHWLHELEPDLTIETLDKALRLLKQRAFLFISANDLLYEASLDHVIQSMTVLAQLVVMKSVKLWHENLSARYGKPLSKDNQEQFLMVIAMGKLGGGELNVSSDIDLIFTFPEDGQCEKNGKTISNHEFFLRLAKKVIQSLNHQTENGYVFRVDMRLRPDGDSGSLVCSFKTLDHYLHTQGRLWERYAWVKARPLKTLEDNEHRQSERKRIESFREPFVFRQYLDFAAIDSLRKLHGQIRHEAMKKQKNQNIKLGPGGIREIEFIAHVYQLIRGGREEKLRIRPTVPTLRALKALGHISSNVCDQLSQAYIFLRKLEHRLQYIDDAQTHNLPTTDEDQITIAKSMGFDRYSDLMRILEKNQSLVIKEFDSIFLDPEVSHGLEKKEIITDVLLFESNHITDQYKKDQFGQAYSESSLLDDSEVKRRFDALLYAVRFLPDEPKYRLDKLIPLTVNLIVSTKNPVTTIIRFFDFYEHLSKKPSYLSLLLEYPKALFRLVQIVSASSWATSFLSRYPILLDELIDSGFTDAVPDSAVWYQQWKKRLSELQDDREQQMDWLRDAYHAQVFRVLMNDLAKNPPVEEVSDHLSDLADAVLQLAIQFNWSSLPQKIDGPPKFAIIAYGKLGGKELGFSSDLDLVFLYDDDHPDALSFYAHLASLLHTYLSLNTVAGHLFEIDTRLRPNGESGYIVASLESFRHYQLKLAWTWEHQALTRARFSAGDSALGLKFEQIRNEILRRPRNWESLRQDVLEMRQKMRNSHDYDGPLFDLKQSKGGLVDIEFLVQALVLRYAPQNPELLRNAGNIALLGTASRLGLISQDNANKASSACRIYRGLVHAQRLNMKPLRVPKEMVVEHIKPVELLWEEVFPLGLGVSQNDNLRRNTVTDHQKKIKPMMIHSIAGVSIGTGCAMIKPTRKADDVAVIFLSEQTNVSVVFTTNAFCAAPVQVSRTHLSGSKGAIRALVINSGNANAGTGEVGLESAQRTCEICAGLLGIQPTEVLVFSTGIILKRLPVDQILDTLPKIVKNLQADHWNHLATSIMTTDTREKITSCQIQIEGKVVNITGVAKGAGMIEPNMATMLSFMATDALIPVDLLNELIEEVTECTFNCITVDGDTSTNDSFVIMATGQGQFQVESKMSPGWSELKSAVLDSARQLAKSIIQDGEGATRLIEIEINGASSKKQATKVGKSIANSLLVKTAFFSGDPNLGRVLSAIGTSGLTTKEMDQIDLAIGEVMVFEKGRRSQNYDESAAATVMSGQEVKLSVNLNQGSDRSTVWTCDLSYDYVRINADYERS